MNYQESLDYIKSLVPTLERPSLTRMESFFAAQGYPQNQLKAFHVGGTNGKGSVSTLLASMLSELGYRCGKFTGPHLIAFNERFVLDGQAIDDSSFARIATRIHQQSLAFSKEHEKLGSLTWFEFLMAMAVAYYSESEVDYCVFEVGLGGRFDATNVLSNVVVSVITNVDLDHMQFLGDTRAKIAFEKAGILKAGIPVLTTCDGDALEVIRERAKTIGCPLYAIKNVSLGASSNDIFRHFAVDYLTPEYDFHYVEEFVTLLKDLFLTDDFASGLNGAYQRVNVLTALMALGVSGITRPLISADSAHTLASLKRGLSKANWPGRFEILESQQFILDGAHNPHGAAALRASLLDKFGSDKKMVFIFTCFENKNAEELLKALLTPADLLLTFAAPASERNMYKPEQLASIGRALGAQAIVAENFEQAVKLGRQTIELEPLKSKWAPYLIATGSFATIREAIKFFGPEC